MRAEGRQGRAGMGGCLHLQHGALDSCVGELGDDLDLGLGRGDRSVSDGGRGGLGCVAPVRCRGW